MTTTTNLPCHIKVGDLCVSWLQAMRIAAAIPGAGVWGLRGANGKLSQLCVTSPFAWMPAGWQLLADRDAADRDAVKVLP